MNFKENEVFAGRYRLISKIGVGGFSEVWKVADQMANDAVVALKVYAPEKGLDEYGLKQFRREYSVVLNLNHQNLLTARHFDIHDGHPYLIMPFCEGGSVYGRIIEKGNYTEEELAEFLVQIAPALANLHENEIVHQDIKPDNILLDGKGNYLLMDFGISGKLRSTLRKSTTSAGTMTVAYAPPEKFKGMGVMSPESDIFSLGVMMIEMLTGDVPWNAMGGAYLKSDDDLPELPDSFSRELRTMINSCLKLDVAERCSLEEISSAAKGKLEKGSWDFGVAKSSARPKNSDRKTEKQEGFTDSANSGRKTQRMDFNDLNHESTATKRKPLGLIIGLVIIIAVGLLWFLNKPIDEKSVIQELINNMVDVQGGTFTMGCTSEHNDCQDDESPAHSVTLSSFSIGKYEVTQAQWQAITGNNPSKFSGCDNCPVENVSWNEIQDFIKSLNEKTGKTFRLPTEAEWEFAARGGNNREGYIYSGSNSLSSVAWFNDNSGSKTHIVGQKSANELGLYDMSGNVWEWCSDYYGSYSGSNLNDPKGTSMGSGQVARGGCWLFRANYCRVSNRFKNSRGNRYNILGFRLVL